MRICCPPALSPGSGNTRDVLGRILEGWRGELSLLTEPNPRQFLRHSGATRSLNLAAESFETIEEKHYGRQAREESP